MSSLPIEELKIHPVSIPGCTLTNKEIGVALGKMRFDAFAEVLSGLIEELERQRIKDFDRSRFFLAAILRVAIERLKSAQWMIRRALDVSRRHMQHEFERHPEITEI